MKFNNSAHSEATPDTEQGCVPQERNHSRLSVEGFCDVGGAVSHLEWPVCV